MTYPHIGFDCRAWARPEWNDIGVWIRQRFPNGNIALAQAVFKPSDEYTTQEPTFKLSREEAQLLANSLWEAGIRPVQSSGSVGQVEAMQNHIADLRLAANRAFDLLQLKPATIAPVPPTRPPLEDR